MAFAWTPKHFKTLGDFTDHLAHARKPWWAKGVTLHHTYRPLPSQWRGLPSMESLGRFYRTETVNADGSKGWPAGPHLFLIAGAPKPELDGIYLGTPLDTQGVHAGICNGTHFGVEIAGDYDLTPWPVPVADLVYGVTLALLKWIGATEMAVRGHRECLPNKTCPGKQINMDAVRFEVKKRLSTPPSPPPMTPVLDYPALWGPRDYHAAWRIPEAWRTDAQRLGKATSKPFEDDAGATWQMFENGAIRFTGETGARVYVWRDE